MSAQTTAAALTRDFALPDGFSAEAALHHLRYGQGDPTALIGTRVGTWLAFRTPSGPVTLRLVTPGPGRAVLGAWGPGAEWALERGEQLLGLTDDWSEVDSPEFAARLPEALRAVRRRNPWLPAPATGRMWDALLPAILGQKVTFGEAQFAYRQLCDRYGEPAPGSDSGIAPPWLRVGPSREAIRRVPSWVWHAARVDYSRSTALLEAARASGLEFAHRTNEAEAYTLLQHLPGVGPWTAAETVQRTHAARDAISVGDFHLAHMVGEALTGRRTDDDGMLALLSPYSGQRQRVVRLIVASGFRKQAFGPKLAPEDHRGR